MCTKYSIPYTITSMKDCLFCKIITGDIPAYKVYEDKDYLGFLDINPLNPGHTLVSPKKHYRWVWDDPNIGNYMEVCQKIVRAQQKSLNVEQVVSIILGDEVPHAHIWLVPRFENDGHGNAIDLYNKKKISEKEMGNIAEKIKEAL